MIANEAARAEALRRASLKLAKALARRERVRAFFLRLKAFRLRALSLFFRLESAVLLVLDRRKREMDSGE